MHWLFLLSQNWLFLLVSEWLILPGSNNHTSDSLQTQRVSVITRCYGFDHPRGGMFRSLGAVYEDVKAFVSANPSGTEFDGNGKVMQEFLKNRVGKRLEKEQAERQRQQAAIAEQSRKEEKQRLADVNKRKKPIGDGLRKNLENKGKRKKE